MSADKSWIDRIGENMDDGMYACPSCGKMFPFIQLKEFRGKRLCPDCIKQKKAGARSARAERKPAGEAVDMAAIEAAIKSTISEGMKSLDASLNDIKNGLQKTPEKLAEGFYVPGTPTERRLFFEICKNKRAVGGNLERNFGMRDASLVHIRLLSMWHDNLLWKDRHGWFMINPEMTKDQLEIALGGHLTSAEYDDYMIEMCHQAINFKFRPLAMLGEKKQKEIEREITLLTP